jgi:predicted NodU family carbamoyl transferase
MWTVAINIRDGVIALFKNDELQFFAQEERLSKIKYDGCPYLIMEMISEYLKDHDLPTSPKFLFIGARKYYEVRQISNKGKAITEHHAFPTVPWTGENAYISILRKKFRESLCPHSFDVMDMDEHFSRTVTGFMHSPFIDAGIIVVDSFGNGFDYPRYAKSLK